MLDLVGAILGMMAIAINLVALTSVLPGPLAHRLSLAAIAGAWVGLATGLGAAGRLVFSPGHPVPLVGVLFAVPLLTVAALAFKYPRMRATLMAIPMPLLIGVNALRVLGVLFLLLAAEGRLSGPFPYSAGWGDIIAGALALPILWLMQDHGRATTAVHLGNPFGMADLVVAIGLGVTSAANSPLGIFRDGAGSEAMQHLPWSFVPTVLVPIYMILHAIIWARLRRPVMRVA